LHYNWVTPPHAMPPTRSKLILDEEAFQGLLAAAFTIQQYNQREGGIDAALSAELNATLGANAKDAQADTEPNALKTPSAGVNEVASKLELCELCGSPVAARGAPCAVCDAETFRPGERLQRTWATMWSISQEQGSFPEKISSAEETSPQGEPPALALGNEAVGDLDPSPPPGEANDHEPLRVLPVEAVTGVPVGPQLRRLGRADLYLGLSLIVALVALLWPTASVGHNQMRPWERMLVAIGIAEAPPPGDVHYSGDPNIKVWVDTEAALYYCPGDELYGKSSGGYYTTQHEAQLDRFEPALRRACVP